MTSRLFSLLSCLLLCLCLSPNRPQTWGQRPPTVKRTPRYDGQLLSAVEFAQLAETDPVRMLAAGLARYSQQVRGYRCTLVKQERIEGHLNSPETIAVCFREQPFSVLMHWLQGGNPRVARTLYVDGENSGKLLVKPRGVFAQLVSYVTMDPDDPRVRSQSRYRIDDFGIAGGMERTFQVWRQIQANGHWQVDYLGVQAVPEVNHRRCHVWRRMCVPPEEDGLTEVIIKVDVKTWLQVSSTLKAGDQLIAQYHFQDLELNPRLAAEAFTADCFTDD